MRIQQRKSSGKIVRLIVPLFLTVMAGMAFAAEVKPSNPDKNKPEDKIIIQDGAQKGDISLNGEWEFTYTPASAKGIPDFPPDSAFDAKIQIPGNWDDQLGRFQKVGWWPDAKFAGSVGWNVQYLSGIGWHRTRIDVPASWRNGTVTLTVGWAPGGNCYVWLNRDLVGRYDYGMYTPFSFDLTPHLKAGATNELIIALNNAGYGDPRGSAYQRGFRGRASGVSGPVTMHISEGPGRITDLYVKPGEDLKEVVWQTDLDAPGGDETVPDSRLLWEVCDVAGQKTIAQGDVAVPGFKNKHQATWKQRISEIEPWSDRHPNLYRTKIQWLVGKQSWDNREQRFGLRRWSREGRRLFLNGQPIYLRCDNNGTCDSPPNIGIPISKKYWMAYLKRLKELGFNSCNFWSWVAPPQLLSAADELGVIVQCGDGTTALEPYRQAYEVVWKPIVLWTRGHPSMCIYGFGGEHEYYEGCIEQFQKQYDLIKKLNTECMVMPQQAAGGIEYGFDPESAKQLTQDPFPHHAERLAKYTKASDIFGSFHGLAFGGAFGYHFFETPWRVPERNWSIYQRPIVVHEIYMRSSYLNPDNTNKYTGRLAPFIYTRLRDQLSSAGLLDNWKTYWENSGRLNAIARKYCVEKARKCDNLAGYEFLGLIDQHTSMPDNTYPSGMLDEFLQFKPGDSAEGILRYSNESVLLLDFDDECGINRSYWEKDKFQADVMVSLYGTNAIGNGRLAWSLKDGNNVMEKGEHDITNVQNGRVSTIQNIKIAWPSVKKTTKLNLSVSLAGSGYQLANDWDFWVFPRVSPPEVSAVADAPCQKILAGRYFGISSLTADSKEKLHIVSEITQKEVDYLAQGGDVLLLGTEPFPRPPKNGVYPAMSGRIGSVVGAVIKKDHAIFAGLPDEGWGDWIFMPVLAYAPRVFFDKSECSGLDVSPWNPILEMISMPGRVDKEAAIFEAQVGKGRLLVSTCQMEFRIRFEDGDYRTGFRLTDDLSKNPSRVTLVDGLLRYISGNEFHPEMKLAPETITALIQGQSQPKSRKASPAPVSISMDKTDGRVWHNNRVTVDLKTNMSYRVNAGKWKEGVKATVYGAGINKLETKPPSGTTNVESREVCIDLSAPTMAVKSTPYLEQEGGVYCATPDTLFAIEARDELSGVKSIEMSIDGAEYHPYAAPFKLALGNHSVRCRVTDHAGNQEETMGGENLSGGPTRNAMIIVRGQ